MRLFEAKKNISKIQNNEEHNFSNIEHCSTEDESSKKTLFLSKSDYGWDGDY